MVVLWSFVGAAADGWRYGGFDGSTGTAPKRRVPLLPEYTIKTYTSTSENTVTHVAFANARAWRGVSILGFH